jgi:hypothetical protein
MSVVLSRWSIIEPVGAVVDMIAGGGFGGSLVDRCATG